MNIRLGVAHLAFENDIDALLRFVQFFFFFSDSITISLSCSSRKS
jgi:hypothetical protein